MLYNLSRNLGTVDFWLSCGLKKISFLGYCMAGDQICHCPILDIVVPVYAPYSSTVLHSTDQRQIGWQEETACEISTGLLAYVLAIAHQDRSLLPRFRKKHFPPSHSFCLALQHSSTVPPTSTTMATPPCIYRWEDR